MTYKPLVPYGDGTERDNGKEIKMRAKSFSENEEDLAHTLVIELLSHQFAYPVQWIETQDALFSEQKIERTVEIGPSNTLTGMAKQTLNLKYRDHDTALSINRQTLSTRHDSGIIYFEFDDKMDKEPKPLVSTESKTAANNQKAAPSISSLSSAPVPHTDQATTAVSDIPISAEEILSTILAEKLKTPISAILNNSTIKQLVGGRSTLENEIVGDLLVEFGNIPEKPEEYSIKELGKALESSNDRRLGKQTLMLLQKVVSTKMPGGFTLTSARKYLERRWGFAIGRQDSVLLSTITSLPTSRLQREIDAELYLDGLVGEHAKNTGLALAPPARQQSVMVTENPEVFKNMEAKQNNLAQQNLNAYASYLNMDLRSADKLAKSYEATVSDFQIQVDTWNAEHGEAYTAGISPIFESKKVRIYSSYWNWALQDLLGLVNEVDLGLTKLDEKLEGTACRIINRATPRLIEVIRYLARQAALESTRIYLRALLHKSTRALTMPPVFKNPQQPLAPRTTVDMEGNIEYSEVPRDTQAENLEIVDRISGPAMVEPLPIRHIRRKSTSGWEYCAEITSVYCAGLDKIEKAGISFKGKTVLLTGAGQKSIGFEIVNGLLSGGAKVIVTTSSLSTKTAQMYQKAYSAYGGKGSELVLVPFNQGSQQDIEALLSYVYNQKDGLGLDLDFVIPFAAIGTAGRAIDTIDSKSELAHRIMLVNVIRLLGAIKKQKVSRGYMARPTHAILPLSPNNGNFGNDGLYAESKIALESLFNKWYSEGWSDYLSLCGVSIGWTRGTGLMNQNDIVAEGLEALGGRTFSRQEMAISILGLMHQPLVEMCQVQPLFADLAGGLGNFPDLHGTLGQIRRDISSLSDIRQAVRAESAEDLNLIQGQNSFLKTNEAHLRRRANLHLGFPVLPEYESNLRTLHTQLKDMVDLDRVVAVVGFSEIGPWGNSRTRWEMEAFGSFTLEGCTEMAWIMGLIKYSEKSNHDGKIHCGWIDVKTKMPLEESEIKERYEEYIVQHAGIRLVEPTFSDNYDPHKKLMIQEIIVQQDLAPFEASEETAKDFKRLHGDKAVIVRLQDGDNYNVFLTKGASIMIPKAIDFKNDVAGQIPTGWNPKTYGISDDIITQVDPNTLYVLTCTVEALLSAGITDPYEIYRYIHFSQLGNCIGTGIGGAASFAKMMRDRFQEKSVQKDILQETFANTTSAWVNMLLLSSSGPIRTPVGACATAIESLDTAYDLIVGGKAKMCIVGGVDDFTEDLSFEFANMKATSYAADERSKGRSPEEMSRPTASSRNGFMESHGAGMQIVCTARLAVDMGLPIYGIVAYTNTSSDKASRSVPAPGKGVLVNAKESATSRFHTPLLDMKYRRRQINLRRQQIVEWKSSEMRALNMGIHGMRIQDPSFDASDYHQYMSGQIELQAKEQEKDVFNSFGNQFWKNNPEISPIKGSLATWGLTIDDLDLASFHGTSTIMNDKNESSIIQDQLTHLGRAKGNTIMSVFQKHLTGHPKGAAGAWMINGCLQSLRTGLIPGNKNADNLDDSFQQYDYIAYTDKSIQTKGIKAFSVTSFGFGQKGAQVIGVHPKYLLATLQKPEYNEYVARVCERQREATAVFNEGLLGNCLFVAKERPPFDVENEIATLLNPNARLP